MDFSSNRNNMLRQQKNFVLFVIWIILEVCKKILWRTLKWDYSIMLEIWTKRRTLGTNSSKHVLAKITTMQRITTPSIVTSCRPIWQIDEIITKDVSCAGEFWNSVPISFYDSSSAVLYAANGEFYSNACRKLMTRTIKNPQHGISGSETDEQTTTGGNTGHPSS